MAEEFLSGRSIVRLGEAGAGHEGGAEQARVVGSTSDGRIRFRYSQETVARCREAKHDARAAVIGLVLAIFGTLVWGYGDLVGNAL